MGYWTRIIRWCRRPSMIKIRDNPGNVLALVAFSIVLSSALTVGVWQYARSIDQPTIVSLNAQIGSLQSEVQALIERKQELENQTKALKEHISALETELNDSCATAEVLAETIDELSYEAAQYREEISAKRKRTLPPLQLSDVNIVTAEPDGDGRLRVWGYTGSDYENIWSAEPVYYDCVAIGDADNDGKREIVAVTRSMDRTKGKSSYEILFDVYKEDESGVWTSSEAVIEDRCFWENAIKIGDVDPANPGNEVVMVTPHWLVVYKFDHSRFVIERSYKFEIQGSGTASLTVEDIDGDGQQEILVSLNEGYIGTDKGYVYVFEGKDLKYDRYPVDVRLGDESLRVGDPDGDGILEVISAGYTGNDQTGYQAYLIMWEVISKDGSARLYDNRKLLVGEPTSEWPWIHLDIGELLETEGEEIALAIAHGYSPDELHVCKLSEGGLQPLWTIFLDCYRVQIDNVLIADADLDGYNEIVATGYGRSDERSGGFYLEVFDLFTEGLVSKWRRLGGDKAECAVWCSAVG